MLKTLFAIFLLVLVAQPLGVHPRSLRSATHSLQNHETSEGVAVASASKYLKAFGYLEDNETNLNDTDKSKTRDLKIDEDLETSIKKFQEYYHLHVSGKLDSETMKLMASPRCGVADIGARVTSRFAFIEGKPRWPSSKRHLTYGFESGAEGAPLEVLRRVFKEAFRQWSRASSFTFEEARNGTSGSDLMIGFFSGEHGDGSSFEKFGAVLAHAFAPPDGRLHVDADQPWSDKVPIESGFYDLVWVAMHEIGHLLGLDHSSHRDAVMYAYVDAGVNRRRLNTDDVVSIRTLYSSPDQDSPAARLSFSAVFFYFLLLHFLSYY